MPSPAPSPEQRPVCRQCQDRRPGEILCDRCAAWVAAALLLNRPSEPLAAWER